MAPDRRLGLCLRLYVCFAGQQELSVRKERQAAVGGWGGWSWRVWGVDVGGWTRDDWASAVSSVHLHMAQCPTSTMLNDKSPASPSSQTDTPSQTPPSLCLHIYTHTHTHAQRATTPRRMYASVHTQPKHAQSTLAGRHAHLLHFA